MYMHALLVQIIPGTWYMIVDCDKDKKEQRTKNNILSHNIKHHSITALTAASI